MEPTSFWMQVISCFFKDKAKHSRQPPIPEKQALFLT
jgi:hypothetical protein